MFAILHITVMVVLFYFVYECSRDCVSSHDSA